MNDKNRNLVVRIASAAVLLPTVIYLLYRGGWWTSILLGGAAAICASEYYTIVWKRIPVTGWAGMVGAGLMPMFPLLCPGSPFAAAFCVVAAMFLFAWTWHLIRGPLAEGPVLASQALTGTVYGGLGLMSLAWLRMIPETGMGWVITALTITFANDTCAYFAGRFFGRRKLYPEVSPNKTWEGFFGGMAGSIFSMFVVKLGFYPFLTWADCAIIGVAGGLFGPVGDLSESMLKRAYGVKDSGKIIPGHGGMLDRIDALIFNAPVLCAYVWVLKPLLG